MIKDLWDKTIDPAWDDLKNTHKKVKFDWLCAEILNWEKSFYYHTGINIILGEEIFPFNMYESTWENKKCIVFNYGILKDYVRQLPDKTWVGFLTNHNNKIILWFKLSD